jgi:hypothetical protein
VLARDPVPVLELGLTAQPVEDLRAQLGRELGVGAREPLERRDPGDSEPVDPGPPHPGHEAEVVVLRPLPRAAREPVADGAVRDRERVRGRRLSDPVEEPPPDAPEVGVEVAHAVGDALARPEHDVHPLGEPPLNTPDLLGVERELEQVSRLARARELRVGDLVRPVREPLDQVGDPAPAAVLEGGLVDDLRARPNRRLGLGSVARSRDLASLRADPLEVGRLVLLPLAPNEVGLRVVDDRPSELPARDREVERGQVVALEEIVEIRR